MDLILHQTKGTSPLSRSVNFKAGSLNLITPPAKEPLTLTETKNHLKIMPDDAIPDDEIELNILVAREKVENEIKRALITQTWEVCFNTFPWSSRCPILIELPPLQSVTSVKYIDTDGVEQTWDSNLYQVNTKSTPGCILPIDGEIYPEVDFVMNAVIIQFVAGYGDEAVKVPAPLRHAMKLIIGELYVRREEAIVGAAITTVPLSASNLMSPYQITHF